MMQKEGQEMALKAMNELMNYFRKKKFPVVLVYHTTPNYGPKPGTEEFEFPKSIKIFPSDIKVTKNFGNAFKKTDLDKILKDKGINTLFMCGLSGTGCIMATYHGALNLDYNMFLIKGTILSPKAKHTEWVEEICQTVGYGALALILKGAE
jgi:nicotinamidase-related amidase